MGKTMQEKKREKELLQRALRAFEKTIRLRAEVKRWIEVKDPDGPGALIEVKWQDKQWHFMPEIRPTLTRAMIGGIVQRLRNRTQRGILVTRYVTPPIADTLKEMDVPFIDTVGNAYFNKPPLLVFVKGNKPPEIPAGKKPIRAFRPTGLQLIFALLCNPDLENAPYREIAEKANVALGTVGWGMRDIKQMGHLVDMGRRGRRLVRKQRLMERWVAAYPEELKPKKLIGRFRAQDPDWWHDGNLRDLHVYWGGEIAAAKATRYLKPQTATIYTREFGRIGQWLIKHRIREEPDGDIEILETFWRFDYEWERRGMVPPLLVYADLLATGDTRNIEAAEMIYEEHLARFVRQD